MILFEAREHRPPLYLCLQCRAPLKGSQALDVRVLTVERAPRRLKGWCQRVGRLDRLLLAALLDPVRAAVVAPRLDGTGDEHELRFFADRTLGQWDRLLRKPRIRVRREAGGTKPQVGRYSRTSKQFACISSVHALGPRGTM